MVIALSGEKVLSLLSRVFCFRRAATCGAVWTVSGPLHLHGPQSNLIQKASHEGTLITITGLNLNTPFDVSEGTDSPNLTAS